MRKTILVGVVVALVAGAASATAASLITSKDIQDGSIRARDIKPGTLGEGRLTARLRAKLNRTAAQGSQGVPGPAGGQGAPGPQGNPGPQGAPGPALSSGNWGYVNRNTEGSPVAQLRSGPTAPAGGAPAGKGSLNLLIGSGTEKVAFGNEVDFAGDEVGGLTQVGFHVFTTGENTEASTNMPGITFEIDPNLASTPSNYSSLVFVPAANSPANQWSGYIDATTTGMWGLTGAAGTATSCSLSGSMCTFAALKAALADGGDTAKILTAAVTKGKDYAWQGAVDGLRINGTVFDFEETGVFEVPAA